MGGFRKTESEGTPLFFFLLTVLALPQSKPVTELLSHGGARGCGGSKNPKLRESPFFMTRGTRKGGGHPSTVGDFSLFLPLFSPCFFPSQIQLQELCNDLGKIKPSSSQRSWERGPPERQDLEKRSLESAGKLLGFLQVACVCN